MEALKDVRALRRGLAVLDRLARRGPSNLAALARETGLPKSTLRRILATLEDAGYIRRSLADGLFRSNINAPGLSHAPAGSNAGVIAAAAKPVLESLSREVVWPSDIFVRDGTELQIIDTTRRLTPLLVNRNEIGDRVDILTTAVGRAYLAFCPDPERESLIRDFRSTRKGFDFGALDKVLAAVRGNGYAVRDATCTGATDRDPFLIDRLYAIAVPVMTGDRVAGCINMLWPIAAAASVGDEKLLVQKLQRYAKEIAANLKRMTH